MIIGITGGIGSGKSTIARELAQRGYAVYDCDREAKRIIAEDSEVQTAIIGLLGQEAFVNGLYNTAYVAQRVFAEPDLLHRLNAIVHPAVKKDILNKSAQMSSVLFIESAILIEAGLDRLCDRIVLVEAPEDVRIDRTIARDYHGEASPEHINKVRARIKAQQATLPPSVYNKVLHVTNDSRTSIAELAQQIILSL
jgi:dephospho-CoA kinase